LAYLSLNYHVVFSTKHRAPSIDKKWRARLHQYLGGTIRGLGGSPMGQGGIEDHVHLLFGLRATHRLCDVVREIKKASTRWVHAEIGVSKFAWQESYAAFTVDWRGIPVVQRYIENQEEHHHGRSFRDELVASLDEAQIPYDPEYLD
jgi:putative transposase